MPAAGSATNCCSAAWARVTANVGGATTSAWPAARAASASWWLGWAARTARAKARTVSAVTRVVPVDG